MTGKQNTWNAYEKLVLSELSDLKTSIATINGTLVEMSNRVTRVEVKAGIWGAAAGIVAAIPVAIAMVYHLH